MRGSVRPTVEHAGEHVSGGDGDRMRATGGSAVSLRAGDEQVEVHVVRVEAFGTQRDLGEQDTLVGVRSSRGFDGACQAALGAGGNRVRLQQGSAGAGRIGDRQPIGEQGEDADPLAVVRLIAALVEAPLPAPASQRVPRLCGAGVALQSHGCACDRPWNPDHGDLEIPDGWEYLPVGDAFLTRAGKAGEVYWPAWKPRSRNRAHRRLIGLWAPADAIRLVEQKAAATASRRAATRLVGARSRQRAEDRYRQQLREAVLRFLDLAPRRAALAEQIADETAARAAVVASGRVGRTRLLSLEQRAELAARAQIRHQHTGYHNELERIPSQAWEEAWLYRQGKGAANDAVNAFLNKHRRR